MELSVENLFALLLRSRLLSHEDAHTMFARWQQEAGADHINTAAFARWMVANGYVTEYQATLLGRGYGDCFFLNQYKILERLGKGRMAGVYKAVHQLGTVVAIKILPPSKAKDPHLSARFQREARLALQLKHPNIVRAYQMGEANGLHYLIMECLEGETLTEVIQRRGPIPPFEAVSLTYQAILGLQHIHEQGMVHRDLKPSNLMVVGSSSGNPPPGPPVVKILDMSLARALSDEPLPDQTNDPQLTAEGTVLGTPDYMAPEQARDARAADIRSDLYSLGCVLYHLLTGQAPFPDSNLIVQMIRHATETPRPLKEFHPAAPDELQRILDSLLAKEPGQRYPTPQHAAEVLNAFLSGSAFQPTPPVEVDAGMRSFLIWIELENSSGDPIVIPGSESAPRPAPDPVPADGSGKQTSGTPELSAPSPSSTVASPPVKESSHRKRSRKHRSKTAKHPSEPVPSASAGPGGGSQSFSQFSLEPPASSPSVDHVLDWGPHHLTIRDLAMFGLGVVTVLVAILLGWLTSFLVRH